MQGILSQLLIHEFRVQCSLSAAEYRSYDKLRKTVLLVIDIKLDTHRSTKILLVLDLRDRRLSGYACSSQKADEPTQSNIADSVAQAMSAVGGGAVKSQCLALRQALACVGVQNLCIP